MGTTFCIKEGHHEIIMNLLNYVFRSKKNKPKSMILDLLSDPDAMKFEIWVENGEIRIRIKRKEN